MNRPVKESEDIRTDLALEARQLAVRRGADVPGVSVDEKDLGFGTKTTLRIESDLAAEIMGKSRGTYVTISVPDFPARRRELESDLSRALADAIQHYLKDLDIAPSESVLVVGLGNWNSTPDSVGPSTTSKLLVTRHLHEYGVLPEEILGRMRPLAALAPGVLGITGIETAEIIFGVVQRVKPSLVICIDALASMSVDRLGTTIQISDTGIHPGSGVGNKRMGLTPVTLGVPVLALGVPTVIYATTIVSDAMDALTGHSASTRPRDNGQSLADSRQGIGSVLDPSRIRLGAGPDRAPGDPFTVEMSRFNDPAARKALFHEVLGDDMRQLVVTPKDIDVMVESLSDVLADGLNEALHPGISAEEAAQLR